MGMPGKIISKGMISEKADALANHPNEAHRQEFMRQLKDWDNDALDHAQILFDVSQEALPSQQEDGKQSRGPLTEKERDYLRRFWLTEWWQEYQPIDFSMRQSMVVAMELAKEVSDKQQPGSRLPVDSYWICTGHHFEIGVTRSKQQITRLILTPGVPHGLPIKLVQDVQTDIWIVKPGNPVEETEERFKPVIGKKKDRSFQVDTFRLHQTRS